MREVALVATQYTLPHVTQFLVRMLSNEGKTLYYFLMYELYIRDVHFYKVIAKVCLILKFRTFLESLEHSTSKSFLSFFSKVGLKGPAFALKFCIFCINPKENTVISSISLWR